MTEPPPMAPTDALLLAHDVLHPEDGGDHLPVKLSSARSSPDTVELASRITALVQTERARIIAALREPPDEQTGKLAHILSEWLDDAVFWRKRIKAMSLILAANSDLSG